jgi:DNA polymerase-3 subunit gamma/tau
VSSLFQDDPHFAAPAAPIALARKWRPRQFASVVGQDFVVKALQHALGQQRLHHAYLLTGSRGVGKTSLARIFAKALNCETGLVAEPCGQCGPCQEIDAGRFIDYVEIDAASNRSVGEIQQLLEQARFAPTAGRFKVYVIDEVHMLTGHAFNAMLKTLEEPPERVKFVLATTDPQKIPVTVLSRCLQFGLKNLRLDLLERHLSYVLTQEGIQAEPEAVLALARAAKGSVRDGLSLTDQAISYGGGSVQLESVTQMLGLVSREAIETMAHAIGQGNASDCLRAGESLTAGGVSAEAILEDLARLFHDVNVSNVLGPGQATDSSAAATACLVSVEQAQLGYQILMVGLRDLAYAPDEQTGLEMTLLRLVAFLPIDLEQGVLQGQAAESSSLASSRSSSSASASGRSASRVLSDAPVTGDSSGSAALPRGSAALRIDSPRPPKFESLSSLTAESWLAVAQTLPLAGLSRQFALQARYLGMDSFVRAGRSVLKFEVPVEALTEAGVVERVASSLATRFGPDIELSVSVGQSEGPSLASQKAGLNAQRQAQAEASIASSPIVKALIERFDATIVPGSIRWKDPNTYSGESS